jgi:hypothetical protein
MGEVQARRHELPEGRRTVVVCRSGGRSAAITDVHRVDRLNFETSIAALSGGVVITLECAGNGRHTLDPLVVEGESWRFGAVSTAEWTGVPLTKVLDRVGILPAATEVVFRGADHGTIDGRSEPIHFERSLPIDTARAVQALLAYAMNGEPLPRQHGYSVRLVVPAGMAWHPSSGSLVSGLHGRDRIRTPACPRLRSRPRSCGSPTRPALP